MQENDINDPTIGSRLDVDRFPAHDYANSHLSTLISSIYDRSTYDLRSLLSPRWYNDSLVNARLRNLPFFFLFFFFFQQSPYREITNPIPSNRIT